MLPEAFLHPPQAKWNCSGSGRGLLRRHGLASKALSAFIGVGFYWGKR